MRTSEELFFIDLQNLSPDIKQVIDDHMNYYEKIHAHILMGEVTKKIVEIYLNGSVDIVKKIFGCIDSEYQKKNEEICNLIDVSMLENLPSTSEKGCDINNYLSKELLDEYYKVNY